MMNNQHEPYREIVHRGIEFCGVISNFKVVAYPQIAVISVNVLRSLLTVLLLLFGLPFNFNHINL
jgi:hypothetical protein